MVGGSTLLVEARETDGVAEETSLKVTVRHLTGRVCRINVSVDCVLQNGLTRVKRAIGSVPNPVPRTSDNTTATYYVSMEDLLPHAPGSLLHVGIHFTEMWTKDAERVLQTELRPPLSRMVANFAGHNTSAVATLVH